jgi:hypothetical protein
MQRLESGYSDLTLQIPIKIYIRNIGDPAPFETEIDAYFRKQGTYTAECNFNGKNYRNDVHTSLNDISSFVRMRIIQQLKNGLLEQIKQDTGLE